MDEPSQFHMTVVSRKRRENVPDLRSNPAADSEPHPHSAHHFGGETHHSQHHHSGQHHSHRHYQDYGTINLGCLSGQPEERKSSQARQAPTSPASPQDVPASGEKYAPILGRKYRKRKSHRTAVIILAAVIVLLLAAFLFGFLQNHTQGSSPDLEPMETLEPLESIDLEDMPN